MIKSLHAWVLHKHWSGDTSARVHLFTRELGLVSCLCRGGRTPKKQALLQAFSPLWVHVNERYNQYYTQSIESLGSSIPLIGNSLFSGLYINELLYYLLSPLESDADLFDAYLLTLNGLSITSNRLDIEALLRRFEWTLLNSCGHSFSFTHEADTQSLIHPTHYYEFTAGKGFTQASKGFSGEDLLALGRDDLSNAAYLKAAKMIMRKAIDHLLDGREIKARALYIHGS